MSESKRLYVGIGIGTYDDTRFAQLPKAVNDIQTLGAYLDQYLDYQVETIADPGEEEARTGLKRSLKKETLPPGSALVLLWSGHGEMEAEALHLIARNTEKGSAPDLTPEVLASFVARCGATQALLLLDTCYSGSGVFEAQRVVDRVRRAYSAEGCHPFRCESCHLIHAKVATQSRGTLPAVGAKRRGMVHCYSAGVGVVKFA